MRLESDELLFKNTITRTARGLKIIEEYVEKDYWLVSILKNLFSQDRGYVFKGGTSLSKCYKLINRFSEDIDISYSSLYEELPITEIKRKFKGITTAIKENGLEIENKDKLRRSAYFNQFVCPYPSVTNGTGIEKKVIIELAGQTPSFPTNKKTIQTFIGEYLEKIGRHDLVEKYELEPFEINVQSLERTLVDKTYAICDYYLSHKERRHSRHLYDLYKISSIVNLDSNLKDLFLQVKEYRKEIPICFSAKDDVKLNEVLDHIINEASFKSDYESVTYPLLYENIDYSKCEESLIKIRDFLSEYKL